METSAAATAIRRSSAFATAVSASLPRCWTYIRSGRKRRPPVARSRAGGLGLGPPVVRALTEAVR
jgi:hypothetical protein